MKIPEYFKKKANLTEDTVKIFQTAFVREEYPKGQFLFKQDEMCRYIYFIEQGFARIYYVSESGREITAWFFPENTFVTAIDSYYYNEPSSANCELTENAIVYSISYVDFEHLLNNHNEFGKFGFHVIHDLARQMTEFINNMKFQTAEDRYKALVTKNPTIFQRVSLGHIASYLGITQPTLSRIRGGK